MNLTKSVSTFASRQPQGLGALLIGFGMFLSGCSSTGGTILGLPVPAPKELKGSVVNNYYVSPGRGFSVGLPYDEDTDKWKYMPVEEGNSGDSIQYVVFGPITGPSIGKLVFDPNRYHVVYAKRVPGKKSGPEYAKMVFDNYNKMAEKKLGVAIEKVVLNPVQINGRPAYYAVYRQASPIGKSKLLKITRHYAYCIIFFENHLANIIVEMEPVSNKMAKEREEILVRMQQEKINHLANSFRQFDKMN